MSDSTGSGNRAAAIVVLSTAIVASAPSLWLPLLSDDWMNLAAVRDGVPWRTPFSHVRPLYLALFRAGHLMWGLTPWPYHVVSMILFAACALLLFTLVRQLSGDRGLALGAAVVFALQPFAIETTAWPSSQGDLLACLFTLASLLAWVWWRNSSHPGAIASAISFFVLALLSKESAIVVPPLIALVEWCLPRKTPRPRTAWAVIAVMAVVAAAHILLLRPHVLGVEGTALPKLIVKNSIGTVAGYVTAIALPLPVEFLEMHRYATALAAAALFTLFALAVWRSRTGFPPAARFALAAAAVAAVPALFGFQERYFLIASAGISVALVASMRVCGRAARAAVIATVAVIWCASIVLQWAEWFAAGRASVPLVSGLTREAADPQVREIVIVNLPHRVRGAPVVTNMATIVELVTQRRIPVLLAGRVDYFAARDDGLDASGGPAVSREGDDVVVRLRVPSTIYRRFVRPIVGIGETVATAGDGSVSRIDAERYVLRIPLREAEGRSVMVWKEGALIPVTRLRS